MAKRTYLTDNNEDALFALLMENVSHEEGIKAIEENKRLKNDPDAELPIDLQNKCVQTIRKNFRKGQTRKAKRTALKIANRIAVAILTCILLATVAFAVSEEVRVKVLNWVSETFEDHTEFQWGAQDTIEESAIPRFTAKWLPDGFVLQTSEIDGHAVIEQYVGPDEKESYVMIMMTQFLGGEYNSDTEEANIASVKINGYDATIVEKDNTIQVIWTCENVIIQILSENINLSQIIKIAENIEID